MKLCALSESGTSYCQMTFAATFFHAFHVHAEKKECGVSLKACLAVFRSLATIEKCHVRLDRAEQNLVFELVCLSDAKKSFRIPLDDSGAARQIPLPAQVPFGFTAAAKQLSEYLVNFQTVIPEITLAPSSAGLLLKSFMSTQSVAADGAGTRALYTNMELPASIFTDFRVPFGDAMELTVTLREFKAFVAFGDFVARPLVLKFTASGQPIALSMTGLNGFSADMMLATVSNNDEDTMSATTAALAAAAVAAATAGAGKPPIKQQPADKKPARSAPPPAAAAAAAGNNADDDNSSSYYYSYDTSRTTEAPPAKKAPPPNLPPVTKQEKVAKTHTAAGAAAAASNAAASSSALAAAAAAAKAARARENANNMRANDMVVDNTEQPSETTGPRQAAVRDVPMEFPPSPTHSPTIPVGALFRDPSPEI